MVSRPLSRSAGVALALALMATTTRARAEKAQVTLRYERREAAVEICPDEATMRSLVAAELGYDPFVPKSERAISITLVAKNNDLTAAIVLASNERRRERTLRSSGKDCSELASSVALAVAVAIDPEAVNAKPAAPPETPSAPTPALVPPPNVPPPPKPANETSLAVPIDLGVVLGSGIVPGFNSGLRGGVALEGQRLSIGVEGTVIFRGSHESSLATVSAGAGFGSIVPCASASPGERTRFDFCASANFGAVFGRAESQVDRNVPKTEPLVSAGPRLGFTWMPFERVGLRASADLDANITRVKLSIDDAGQDQTVWRAPIASFLGGAALIVRLH
jgi:hypothetical protein